MNNHNKWTKTSVLSTKNNNDLILILIFSIYKSNVYDNQFLNFIFKRFNNKKHRDKKSY
jgi:hypothetical protein